MFLAFKTENYAKSCLILGVPPTVSSNQCVQSKTRGALAARGRYAVLGSIYYGVSLMNLQKPIYECIVD